MLCHLATFLLAIIPIFRIGAAQQDLPTPIASASELTRDAQSLKDKVFDFIIVGAGNAGLVIANRLSEDPNVRVLLIESGDDTRNDSSVYQANEFYDLNRKSANHSYNYHTVPQINDTVKTEWFGRGLGGSTTVNGQVWNAPSREQVDHFGLLGNQGWSFDELLPYYMRAQDYHPPSQSQAENGITYEPSVHSSGGPVTISHPDRTLSGLPQQVFARAVKTGLGIERARDLQSGDINGFAFVAQTLYPDTDLRRVSSATSYYNPIENKRPNLTILLTWRALRLVWEDPGLFDFDGIRASGVVVQNQPGGESVTLSATQEIVLSCGVIRSPFLLEHSGVGDVRVLEKIGVKQVVDLPGVGRHFNEQCFDGTGASIRNRTWRADGASSSIALATASQIFSNITDMETYVGQRIAQWAQDQVNAGAAVDAESLTREYELLANTVFRETSPTTEYFFGNGGISISVYMLTPFSRGYTHANVSDPWAIPEVNPRYFTVPFDMDMQVAALTGVKKLYRTPELLSIMNGTDFTPECKNCSAGSVDEYSFYRSYVITNFGPLDHAVGTCSMKPQQSGGVVDSELKVYGTSNVRVIDASVIPVQISAHTQATVYAVAERGADFIKAAYCNNRPAENFLWQLPERSWC